MKWNSLTEPFQPKENKFIILASDQFFKKTGQKLTFRKKKVDLFNRSYLIEESLLCH